MKTRSIDYQETLMEALKDPKESLAYLNAAAQDNNTCFILSALKNVLLAQDESMAALAEKANLSPVKVYRMVSPKGNPKFCDVVAILKALGFQITLRALNPGQN